MFFIFSFTARALLCVKETAPDYSAMSKCPEFPNAVYVGDFAIDVRGRVEDFCRRAGMGSAVADSLKCGRFKVLAATADRPFATRAAKLAADHARRAARLLRDPLGGRVPFAHEARLSTELDALALEHFHATGRAAAEQQRYEPTKRPRRKRDKYAAPSRPIRPRTTAAVAQ